MGNVWMGREIGEESDIVAMYDESHVWEGNEEIVDSLTGFFDRPFSAVYEDGEIWATSEEVEDPITGYKPPCDACYENGLIWVGSEKQHDYMADAHYHDGSVWLGPERTVDQICGEDEHKIIAVYDGDDDGAAAAVAFLLFLNGSTPDIEESDDEENGSDSGDSDGGGSSYEPNSYVYSGNSSSSVEDSGSSSSSGFLGLLFFIGVIVFIGFCFKDLISRDNSVSPSGGYEQQSQKTYQGVMDGNNNYDPWLKARAVHLSLNRNSAPLRISKGGRLLSGDQVITEQLRYAGSNQLAESIKLSEPSPSGRYQFLTLCDEYYCNENKLIDIWAGRLVEVRLYDAAVYESVSWSPDENYAVTVWSHGGRGGLEALNTKSLKVISDPEKSLQSVFPNEKYDVNYGGSTESAPPLIAFEIPTLKWKNNTEFQIEGVVMKLRWADNIGTPFKDGKVIIDSSVLDLGLKLVKRITQEELLEPEEVDGIYVSDARQANMLAKDTEAAQEWLYYNQQWRMLTKSDCQCDDYLPQLRKFFDNRHPYYAAGDFNGDGKLDFAIVIMNKETKTLAVAVFKGPVESRAEPDVLRLSVSDPSRTLLFYDSIKSRLLVGNEIGSKGKGSEIKPGKDGYELEPTTRPICGTKNSGSMRMCLDAAERRYK